MSTKDEEDAVELHPLVPSKSSFSQDEDLFSPRASESYTRHPTVNQEAPRRSERWTKLFVLALACTFSIGSHYSQDCLGPLKDILKRELNISDTQMSLILGSHLVANTILPIIAGVLVARFGTLKSSLFATGVLFLGQAINLVAVIRGSVHGMIFGLCLFGSGISPLSLIQETLVVQVFDGESMGLAVALGLVVGKATSFIASFTTVPLALYTPLTYRTPFIVSTSLTFFSVVLNVIFVTAFYRPSHTGTLSKAESHIRAHKTVAMTDIYAMSGLFWWYLVVCLLAGMVWIPFVQLSTTIIKHRFGIQDVGAAEYASIIQFFPIVLYPLIGWFTDRYGRRICVLLVCSLSSLACYVFLLIPPAILGSPLFSVICFAFGYGPAPLLLVIIAPFLTEHISTALGLHKALEMAGSTLMQTSAGFLIDFEARAPELADPSKFRELHVIWIFTALNVLYVISNVTFLRMDKTLNHGNVEHAQLRDIKEGYNVLERMSTGEEYDLDGLPIKLQRSKVQVWQVRLYIGLCGLVLLLTWISFGVIMGYRRS